ncbi:MAG: hypothetical protein D6696_18840 [Acidobacteria bacterium]|nr:MAG: hypothetical protein D6696_18840 [Acidobacteriota bacterium]
MLDNLPASIVLIVLPLWLLAGRRGWLARPWGRRTALAASLVVVAFAAPWQGVELEVGRRLNLVLAAATLALLGLPRLGVERWGRRGTDLLLAALAGGALLVNLNFFAFHGVGQRIFVHYYDVAHYYLGAKYFGELGYDGLYTAMLRAEAELYDNRLWTLEARDLTDDRIVHVRVLLERSEPLKAAFTAERWRAFLADVAFFRRHLGQELARFYLDRGFNATPVWALAGGWLADAVPAEEGGILLLAAIDPLLLAAMFAAVGWAFGRRAMLLSLIYLSIAYGATFGWVGGAFLRYGWLTALVGGFCCLARRRSTAAGVLLAIAAGLRIFPALFAVGLAAVTGRQLLARRRLPADLRRTIAAALVTGLALVLATALLPQGLAAWPAFGVKSRLYADALAPNVVGLTPLLAYEGRPQQVDAERLAAIQQRRARFRRWQMGLVFVPLLVATAWAFGRRPLLEAMAGGGLLLAFTGLNLAAYYWSFLVLLLLAHRRRPAVALGLFGLETAVYLLALFEPHPGMLFLYRSLLVLYLLLALYLPALAAARPWRRAARHTTP